VSPGSRSTSGSAARPHRRQFAKLVKLAEVATTPLQGGPRAEMFTVRTAARYSGITENTLRTAIKAGRLPFTVDISPGTWPRSGRYLIRQADVEAFKLNGYDPYFKNGRCRGAGPRQAVSEVLAFHPTNSRDNRKPEFESQ